LKTKIIGIVTTWYFDEYNRNKQTMMIKRTGEQIDIHVGINLLLVMEEHADRLSAGDVLVYGDRGRWQITGPCCDSCGLIFFPIQRIEKWRGTPPLLGRVV